MTVVALLLLLRVSCRGTTMMTTSEQLLLLLLLTHRAKILVAGRCLHDKQGGPVVLLLGVYVSRIYLVYSKRFARQENTTYSQDFIFFLRAVYRRQFCVRAEGFRGIHGL